MKAKFTYILILVTLVVQGIYAQGYQWKSYEFTPKSPTSTYLGAILDLESLNTDTYRFINVAIKPIRVSNSLPGTLSTIIEKPSYNNMIDAIRVSIQGDNIFKGSVSFSYSMNEFNSYNELSRSFGQRMNPTTYFDLPNSNKTKKTLVVFNIKQTIFQTDMSLPHDGKLYEDIADLEQYDMDKLIYINSVQFGRKATLIVESDLEYLEVKLAIEEMLDTKSQPSAKSKLVLANSIIRIMTIGGDEILISNSDNPLENLLNYMYKEFTIQDFGTPISFGAAYLKDNGMFENKFTIE